MFDPCRQSEPWGLGLRNPWAECSNCHTMGGCRIFDAGFIDIVVASLSLGLNRIDPILSLAPQEDRALLMLMPAMAHLALETRAL